MAGPLKRKTTPRKTSNSFQDGLAAHKAKRLPEALNYYKAVSKEDPNYVFARTNMGSVLRQLGQHDQAITILKDAHENFPDSAATAYNLGNAYLHAHQYKEALIAFKASLRTNPTSAECYYGSGMCLEKLLDREAAMRAYQRCLELNQRSYDACVQLAGLHHYAGQLTEAIELLERAAGLEPQQVAAWNNLGSTYLEVGRFQESLAAYKQAFAITPSHRIASNILFALQYHQSISDNDLLETAKSFGKRFPEVQDYNPGSTDLNALKIGFVSADLYAHPVGFYLRSVVAELVKQGARCFFYSNSRKQDATTAEIAAGNSWRNIVGVDDDAVAAQIRKDNIDILVDLAGHSSGNRLAVFAKRPAPVQVAWLGYFATTGLRQMDAILMDSWHVPDGAEKNFSERVMRLPNSRFCYSPPDFAPAVSTLPALQNDGHISFGSFNNSSKINDEVIALWSRVLLAVDKSRLILKWRTYTDAEYATILLQKFEAQGITKNRIELRGQSVHLDLLNQYADIDVALDPFPFCGGQTSCEALWMGVPVITLPRTRAVSRQTLSFLANIGHEEWAAKTEEEYINIAVNLTSDIQKLSNIRQTLRQEMANSPLCDVEKFTKNFLIAMHRLLQGDTPRTQ